MRHLRVTSCLIIAAILCAECPAYAQTHKKYFEYNNPQAIKLSRKTLALVTTREWYLNRTELVMRGDTLQFSPLGGPDQWFKSNNKFSVLRTTGTWAVHRKKYIVCKPDTSGRNPNIPDFILSVIALTDSSMVLQKLHTSNLDMFRTYYFSTKPGRNMRERMAGDAMMYYPPVNLRSVKYSHMEGLDSVTIDSLSFQYKELLIQDKFDVSDSGVLEIETRDSIYHIHLRSRAGKEGRHVFRADENVGLPKNVKRFTPDEKDVFKAEFALEACVLDSLRDSGYEGDFSLDDQFRQLAGYFNAKGERMIRIAAFVSYHRHWRTEFVDPEEYKGALLITSINLKTGRCEDLILR